MSENIHEPIEQQKPGSEDKNPSEEGELQDEELDSVTGGADKEKPLMATVVTNLTNMRHEMLKAVANNLRS
jgi:hypothetical protein